MIVGSGSERKRADAIKEATEVERGLTQVQTFSENARVEVN
jgi:hypothetical protein